MHCSDVEAKSSRREFFRAAARYVSLAALLGAAASLFARKRVDASGCEQNRVCASCARLSFCQRPPAPAARLAAKSVAATRQSAADFTSPNNDGGSLPRSRYEESL